VGSGEKKSTSAAGAAHTQQISEIKLASSHHFPRTRKKRAVSQATHRMVNGKTKERDRLLY
jgi:hypothetical protein